MVVEDTVRADALSLYGASHSTSPQLNLVAESGVTFEDVTSPGSWTWTAHASLFTGLFPWEHGAHFALPTEPGSWSLAPTPFSVTMPREDLPTLAEKFREAGYRTVSVSGNILIGPGVAQMVRGFEESFYESRDVVIVERAREAMARDDDRPLFLFVNLFGAHGPHTVYPTSWIEPYAEALNPETAPAWLTPFLAADGKEIDLHHPPAEGMPAGPAAIVAGLHPLPDEAYPLLRTVYEGEVMAVDYALRALIASWSEIRGDSGVTAVTSDHGEYFGEHGLMEHGRTIYPEVTRVPLVIAAPGRLPKNQRIDTPVQMHDLHDTLLELAGLPHGANSLLPLIQGAAPEPRPIRAAAWPDHYWAKAVGGIFEHGHRMYREGDLALLVSTDGTNALYDLGDDPGMTRDLSVDQPTTRDRLLAAANDAFTVPPEAIYTEPLVVEPEVVDALRALGYVE